jgi:hypothetical protein
VLATLTGRARLTRLCRDRSDALSGRSESPAEERITTAPFSLTECVCTDIIGSYGCAQRGDTCVLLDVRNISRNARFTATDEFDHLVFHNLPLRLLKTGELEKVRRGFVLECRLKRAGRARAVLSHVSGSLSAAHSPARRPEIRPLHLLLK